MIFLFSFNGLPNASQIDGLIYHAGVILGLTDDVNDSSFPALFISSAICYEGGLHPLDLSEKSS